MAGTLLRIGDRPNTNICEFCVDTVDEVQLLPTTTKKQAENSQMMQTLKCIHLSGLHVLLVMGQMKYLFICCFLMDGSRCEVVQRWTL